MNIYSSFIYIYTPCRFFLFPAFLPLPIPAPCAPLRTVPESSARGIPWCPPIPAGRWLRLLLRFPNCPPCGNLAAICPSCRTWPGRPRCRPGRPPDRLGACVRPSCPSACTWSSASAWPGRGRDAARSPKVQAIRPPCRVCRFWLPHKTHKHTNTYNHKITPTQGVDRE